MIDGGDDADGSRRGHASGTSGTEELAGQTKKRRRYEENLREDDAVYPPGPRDNGYSVDSGIEINGEAFGGDGVYGPGDYTAVNGEAYCGGGVYGSGEDTAVNGEAYCGDGGYGSGEYTAENSYGCALAEGNNRGHRGDVHHSRLVLTDWHGGKDDGGGNAPFAQAQDAEVRRTEGMDADCKKAVSTCGFDDTQFDVHGVADEDLGGDEHDDHPFNLPPCDNDLGYVGCEELEAHLAEMPAASSQDHQLAVPPLVAAQVVRRRLTGKTSPTRAAELGHSMPVLTQAEPPNGDLVTREVARAAQKRLREAALAHGKAVKQARTTAWASIRRNPEATRLPEEQRLDGPPELRDAEPVTPALWEVHASHEAAASPGVPVVYCRRCGAWSLGERSKNLVRPCSLKPGHPGNLRMLQLGIVPRRGARIPAELKQAGARGTRGGATVRRKSKARGWR